jgi:hypothetical protein
MRAPRRHETNAAILPMAAILQPRSRSWLAPAEVCFDLRHTLILAPAIAFIAAPAMAGDQPIETGYWEARSVWLGLSRAAERWCVKPQDVAKFMSGPSNHNYHCVYPVSTAADGQISFDGACTDKNGLQIKLRGQGVYTPTSVHMTASGAAVLLGVPVTGDASVDAQFISTTCPADAKAFS